LLNPNFAPIISTEETAMATVTQALPELVSLEEYLQTSYRPDCDYVDGILEERNVGDSDHSDIQSEIIFWFRRRKEEWNIRVNGELRTRVGERRYRVPDVCVRLLSAPREKFVTVPPLIAIEILSPDDRLPRVIPRLRDFLAMGVPNVWLLDPTDRAAYAFAENGLNLVEESRLTIPGSPIYLDLIEVFAALD
jgi:Uma2 family endonuclease